jgi:RNA polymerase-binding transcription factor DksA
MDDMDVASAYEEAFNEAAVSAARARQNGPLSTGICQSCHERIEPERLHANPRARLCSDCAAEDEARLERLRRCGPA